MKQCNLNFWLNGEQTKVSVPITATLLDVLREYLGMTGTKRGCEIGECGSCTVLLNGQAVNSCTVLALKPKGRKWKPLKD